MELDRQKFAVWIVLGLLVGGALLFRHEHRTAVPVVDEAPAVVVVPAPEPAPPPPIPVPPVVVIPLPVPPAAPVATAPPKRPSVAPPAPRIKTKAVIKPKPKGKRKPLDCSLVPAEAYQHAEFLVVNAARARGITEAQIAILRECIKRHV